MTWCAGLLCVSLGCNQQSDSVDELIQRAGELPGVRQSRHSKLRQEFRLVERSQTLPEQLNSDSVLAHQNAAVALANALGDMNRVTEINEQAAAFLGALPAADAEFVAAESGALSAKWLGDIQSVAEAGELPKCDFGLRFERGYFNELAFLYQAAAASRLLLVDALYNLDEHPSVATRRFAAAWKWTDRLVATGHLEARVQAAIIRGDALNVLEVIANHPGVTVDDLRMAQKPLAISVAEWPSMAAALQRERAMAMAAYEAIRLGLTDMLFTLEERSQLREEGVYESLRRAEADQIDADEAAYLTYMREVIAVAEQPYFARSKHLVECDRLLRAGEHVESFPWFANRLFVLNNSMTLAQAEIARDRARIEGWLHLLAAATGDAPPDSEVNPLNGQKYMAQTRGNVWFLALGDRRSVNPTLSAPTQ